MGRPREHDETTGEALLRAAEHLLDGEGPGGLSLRRIAEEAGTTTRAVYTVFGSKRDLAIALNRKTLDRLRVRLEELPHTGESQSDLVAVGVDGFRRFAIEHPNLFRFSFERLFTGLDHEADDLETTGRAQELLTERVRRLARTGLVGNRSLRDVTFQFHALCQGLASAELRGWLAYADDPEQVWRSGLTAYVLGLSATAVLDHRGSLEPTD